MSKRKHYSSQDKVKILREHFEQNQNAHGSLCCFLLNTLLS